MVPPDPIYYESNEGGGLMPTDCKDCVNGHCDRWDHLVLRVRPPHIAATAADTEVKLCSCGGVFMFAENRLKCGLCGFFEPTNTDPEIGMTLNEVLLMRRKKASTKAAEWRPSDDDVKVTVA